MNFLLDGHLSGGDDLEMKVVGCRGATFRPIIKGRPTSTEVSHELEVDPDVFINGLKAVVYMGDGEVRRKNRHRIAEYQVIVTVEDPFLAFREMIQAKETLSSPFIDIPYFGCTTFYSAGIILKADWESFAG